MKFKTYDNVHASEKETEVVKADANIVHKYIQTWVPGHLTNILKYPSGYDYSLFKWEKVIGSSFVVGQKHRCFGAITESRLDGLLCLSGNSKFKIEFIATAPWNYYKIAKMKWIGSGLIFFTIMESNYCGFSGEFYLNALPDAEKFYESIGMVSTGVANAQKLKEFHMSKNHASEFKEKFKNQVS